MLVRLPISLATALLLTAALYLGMQALIKIDGLELIQSVSYEIQRPKAGAAISIPEDVASCYTIIEYFPPEAPAPLSEKFVKPTSLEQSALPFLSTHTLALDSGQPNWNARPMHRQEPKFEGVTKPEFITLAFDVTSDGSVAADTITVLESSSSRVKRPAIRAVKQWKYFPKLVDGRSVWQRDVRVRFTVEPAS